MTASPVASRKATEQRDRRGDTLDRDKGGGHRPRHGKELEARGGDDAKRAFGADEQVSQVVARVVLAQALEPVEHATVGQDHLESEHQLAGDPVPQRREAAGVGREIAADLAAALGAERQREVASSLRRGPLHLGQHATGFGGDREIRGVYLAHPVHTRQREHDLPSGGVRCRAAAVARVPAVRHDADRGVVADREHGRDLVRRAWQHDQPGHAAKEPAEITEIWLDRVGRLETGVAPERRADPVDDAVEARVYAGTDSRHCGLVSSNCRSPIWRSRQPPSQ